MQIPRRKPLTANVGVFGVGHKTYWSQFNRLREELMGYLKVFEKKVRDHGVNVIDFGLIDTAQSAYATLKMLQAADLDLIFCDMLTFRPCPGGDARYAQRSDSVYRSIRTAYRPDRNRRTAAPRA